MGVHGPLKTYWGQERNKLEEDGKVVTKDNFVEVCSKAHMKAFTRENILAAFRKTGLEPFNPAVVTEDMLAPSQETSIQFGTALPTVQSGPVDTVLQVLH